MDNIMSFAEHVDIAVGKASAMLGFDSSTVQFGRWSV
jgi:hypothetical protein